MAISSWSTTAGSNDTADATINWQENQAPSTVNNSARAMMAAVRTWYEDVEWRDFGHTVTQASATTFTIGSDVTSIYVTDRPIRCVDSSTLYGVVSSSSYSSPNTTVTVTLDSGSLTGSLSSVALGFTPTNQPLHVASVRDAVDAGASNTFTGNNTFSGTATFDGNVDLSADVDLDGNEGNDGQVVTQAAGGATLAWWTPKGCHGCVISNNGTDANNDIDISTGYCVDSTGAYILKLTSALTKQLDGNWVAGTNQGGLDTGAEATSTWYYVFLIRKDSDGTVDVLFSASASSPTMPSGYTYKALIGAFYNNGSGNIEAFNSRELSDGGVHYTWSASTFLNFNGQPSAAGSLVTLTAPTSIRTWAHLLINMTAGGSADVTIVMSPDEYNIAPTAAIFDFTSGGAGAVENTYKILLTNTSGQVRERASNGSSGDTLRIYTRGFTQIRGI